MSEFILVSKVVNKSNKKKDISKILEESVQNKKLYKTENNKNRFKFDKILEKKQKNIKIKYSEKNNSVNVLGSNFIKNNNNIVE